MSHENTAWFHCGHCGSLFRSALTEEGRRCSRCGEDPSLGIEKRPSAAAKALASLVRPGMPAAKLAEGSVRPEYVEEPEVRRKEKTSYLAVKVVAVWLGILLVTLLVAQRFLPKESREDDEVSTISQELPSEDATLLQEVLPKCRATLLGFLQARTPEEKNQFVKDPVATVGRMARFYASNPMGDIDPSQMIYAGAEVLRFGDRKGVETRWRISDGRSLDAVFFPEKGEWRLDWDHFVRYSESPWVLFLAGSGTESSEFRLLARERWSEQEEDGKRPAKGELALVFHLPKFGRPLEAGPPSPEFTVDAESVNGRVLKAAFEARRNRAEGEGLPAIDPEGMIRVRVKIGRTEGEEGRKFELEQVLATDWLCDEFSARTETSY